MNGNACQHGQLNSIDHVLFFSLPGAYLLQFMTAPTSPHYFRAGQRRTFVWVPHTSTSPCTITQCTRILTVLHKLKLQGFTNSKDIDSKFIRLVPWKRCHKVILICSFKHLKVIKVMMLHPVGLWRVEEQCGVAWNEAVKRLNAYCICITMLTGKNMWFLLWDQLRSVIGLNYTAYAVILNLVVYCEYVKKWL